MPLTLIIVDDHKLIRDGLRALLQRESDFLLLGEAADGREGVRLVAELKPDVVVIDLSMPELNGIEATRQMRSAGYGGGIVLLSSNDERRKVLEAQEAGADAIVHKDLAFEQLLEAIAAAHRRTRYISPRLSNPETGAPLPTVASLLTPREREVLQLLAEGNNVKEIAFRLDISVKTVETHRMHLMTKLRVDNLSDLTRLAIREGIAKL